MRIQFLFSRSVSTSMVTPRKIVNLAKRGSFEFGLEAKRVNIVRCSDFHSVMSELCYYCPLDFFAHVIKLFEEFVFYSIR